MCSDFDKIFSFLSMSNSELFLVREDIEEVEFDLLKRPMLEFQEECHIVIASQDPDDTPNQQHQEQECKDHESNNQEAEECKILDSSLESKRPPSLGELKVEDDNEDDNDGFKTPTSLDHKIPVITQCPLAPRKPPNPLSSTKRKASPQNVRRRLQLDLSLDVESLFPAPIRSDLYKKIKKARRDNNT